MAEKSFGVKEINLIGASGTPTIESPNNLNLNAVNVAISTNVSIGGTLSVTGNVSVGGTLTYEDVTNVDSVGVVTARDGLVVVGKGVSIAAGGLNVSAGVGTFAADIYANSGQIRKNAVVWLNKDGSEQCSYTAGTTGGGDTGGGECPDGYVQDCVDDEDPCTQDFCDAFGGCREFPVEECDDTAQPTPPQHPQHPQHLQHRLAGAAG